jgi:ABC-type proline/glycine betaine transport system permease subunit
MNKNTINKTIATLSLFVLLLPAISFGQEAQYEPISVVPGVIDSGEIPEIEVFLNNIFEFSIGVAAIIAVVQITLAGLEYMTSNNYGSIANAKDKIWDAIIGLLIILSTYIILSQINPEITKFKLKPNLQERAELQTQSIG